MQDTNATRKAAWWVALVFIVGIAVGAVGMHLCHRHRLQKGTSAANPAPVPTTNAQRVERLTKELDLTPDQKQQIDVIVTQTHARYDEIHKQGDDLEDQARQDGRNRIRAILTPEQKEKFEEHLRKVDAQRKHAATGSQPAAPPAAPASH